jgi:hypothetical protein
MFGGGNNRMFVIKCLMKDSPFRLIAIGGMSIIFVFSYAIKIIEGPLFLFFDNSITSVIDFSSFSNCIWYSIITMATVGYGEYYPQTTLGRGVAVMIALTGSLISAVLITALTQTLQLNDVEQRAVEFIDRMAGKEEIKEEGSQLFKYTFRYLIAVNNYLKALKSTTPNPQLVNHLQRRVEETIYDRITFKKAFRKKIQ